MFKIPISGQVQLCGWNELSIEDRELLARAVRVRRNASVQVSGFMVGAAIRLQGSNRIFYGCNVEDNAQTSTVHAEASALATMIAARGPKARCGSLAIALGHQTQSIVCPPVVTGDLIKSLAEIDYTPCGHCRGLLSQFCDSDMRCLCLQKNGQIVVSTMADFFPCGFSL